MLFFFFVFKFLLGVAVCVKSFALTALCLLVLTVITFPHADSLSPYVFADPVTFSIVILNIPIYAAGIYSRVQSSTGKPTNSVVHA